MERLRREGRDRPVLMDRGEGAGGVEHAAEGERAQRRRRVHAARAGASGDAIRLRDRALGFRHGRTVSGSGRARGAHHPGTDRHGLSGTAVAVHPGSPGLGVHLCACEVWAAVAAA